jgi:hypothetical protein
MAAVVPMIKPRKSWPASQALTFAETSLQASATRVRSDRGNARTKVRTMFALSTIM